VFNAPQFEAWSLENLAKFAYDSYAKMVEQEEEIHRLESDLKMALNAYRQLNSKIK